MDKRTSGLKNLRDRPIEERREIARKGGLTAGENRRKKQYMKEAMELVLSSMLTGDGKKTVRDFGIDVSKVNADEINNALLMAIGVVRSVIETGNAAGYREAARVMGELNEDTVTVVNNNMLEIMAESARLLGEDE